MIVVPRDDVAEVEAMIDNKDIGFVQAGQPAAVKFDTLPFTHYGTVAATVAHVSADAVNDEKRGLAYVARLRLSRGSIDIDGHETRLVPGMAVSVEVKTGSRRVIEYFLSPLLQRTSESLRER
jgi:hemolysin D